MAKNCHFGKILTDFGNVMKAYFVLGKLFNLIWQKRMLLGKDSLL